MRKNVFFYLSLLAMMLFVASCSDDDNVAEEKPQPTEDIVMKAAVGDYYGDFKSNGNGYYKLAMNSEAIARTDLPDEKMEVVMVMSSKMAFVPFNIALPEGTYAAAESGVALTFEPGVYIASTDTYSGSHYKQTTNGVVTKGPIADGEFKVTKGAEPTITAEFTDAQGEAVKYQYKGAIVFEDHVEYDADFTYNDTEFSNVRGYYWGKSEAKPNGLFTTLMVAGTPDRWGELEGAGYELGVDSYSAVADYARLAEITSGTYTIDYTGDLFTGGAGEDRDGWPNYFAASYIRERVLGNEDDPIMHYVIGGTYNVQVEGEYYYFLFDLVTDKQERFTAKFEGEIKFTDEVTLSSLREDIDMPVAAFDKGYMIYNGVKDGYGDWEVFLLGQGVTVGAEGISGLGEFLQLKLTTAASVTDAVGAGVYKVDDKVGDYVTLRGDGYAEFELFYNSWYFEFGKVFWENDEGEMEEYDGIANYAPIHMGEVKVDKAGDVYTVTVATTDDYPNKIAAKFSGELLFVDGTESLAPMLTSYADRMKASTSDFGAKQTMVAKQKRALRSNK